MDESNFLRLFCTIGINPIVLTLKDSLPRKNMLCSRIYLFWRSKTNEESFRTNWFRIANPFRWLYRQGWNVVSLLGEMDAISSAQLSSSLSKIMNSPPCQWTRALENPYSIVNPCTWKLVLDLEPMCLGTSTCEPEHLRTITCEPVHWISRTRL